MNELEIPEGWELKKLEEICTKITDGEHLKPKVASEGISFVSAKDLKENGVDFSRVLYVNKSDAEIFRKKCNPEKNDILIGSRGSIGRICLVNTDEKFCLLGSVILIKLIPSIQSKFILYFLQSSQTQNKLLNASGHSVVRAIYLKDIKTLRILVAPIEIQKKIVKKLDYILGQLEEKKKEIISRIEKFDAKKINQNHKNHLLKLAFDGTLTNEKPGEIIDGIQVPKGWELKKISDIIEILYGKGLPKDKRNNGGKFPVYGSNGVVGTHTEYLIDYPSIIIGRKGSAGAINLTSTKFWPTDVTYYVKIKNSKIPLKFVYYLLNDLNLHKLIQSGPKPGLNRNDVYELDFLFPVSNETQKKIVEILDKKFVEWETHKQELENIQNGHDSIKKHLSNLSLSILNDAFSGKLVN